MSISLGWEGSIGLASHWSCVKDNSGLLAYGLNSLCQEDEHHAYAPSAVALFYFYFLGVSIARSLRFDCSIDQAKRSSYRAANGMPKLVDWLLKKSWIGPAAEAKVPTYFAICFRRV